MSNQTATLVATENYSNSKQKRFDRQSRKAHKSFRNSRKNKHNLWAN
jgi:hypothetical protein